MNERDATPKVALVGCGGWGKNLARNLHQLRSLAAIVDPSPGAAAIARDMQVVVSRLSDILNDTAIAGVVIATPASTHFEIAKAALQAGKDVFVEKPIALNVADGLKLRELAEADGRVLMVGHLLHYHPVFRSLLEQVRGGALGQVRHIVSNRFNFGILRTYEDVIWSFAPHDISMILALAGKTPETVSAHGAPILQPGVADIATVHMEFGGGLSATINSSWLHPQKEQKLIVVGDVGMAVFDDRRPWSEKLAFHRNRVEWTDGSPRAVTGTIDFLTVPDGEPLRDEMAHFLSAIADRGQPRTDAHEAIGVLRVLQAAQESLDKGAITVSLTSNGDESLPKSARENVFVHDTAVVDEGVQLGAGTRIWHFSHVLGKSKIGAGCIIGQNVMIGPEVTIGSRCKIQNNVAVYKGVTIEDDVFCGPSMVFTNVLTPRAHIERKDEFAPTLIGRGATLGANSTIVCGNNIGRFAMVGAGAVVTRDVPAHALVVGNPARRIGWVSEAGERLGQDMICPRTGEVYELVEGAQQSVRRRA